MKLKCKLFGAAALLGAAMLVNANMGASEESQNVALTDLVNATEANAECVDNGASRNNGICNWSGTRCRLDPETEKQDCDFYASR